MWNRSYRWQRQLRCAAGVAVLVGLLAGFFMLAGPPPARRALGGARDLVNEVRSTADQTINVSVPADLGSRPGTLVYQERQDGGAHVIGRVVTVGAAQRDRVELEIRLMAHLGDSARFSGVLKGAPASLDLRDAVRLLISPNSPADEARVARDTIWPSVQDHVLPEMIDSLVREISSELGSLDKQDEALLSQTIQRLREELRPLENKLVDRLAQRTWDTVGVQGLASGILRKTSVDAQNRGIDVARWWGLLNNAPESGPVERPFFSDQTREALRTALEDEALAFWKEHRLAIVDALKKVAVEQRDDFEAAFEERWAGRLYERAIAPAWAAGQDEVLESIQVYANGFAARRLLTKEGGPRLMFAYALRSSLNISEDPLLIFVPGRGNGVERIAYEPLLR
jgi:hypothetical protein